MTRLDMWALHKRNMRDQLAPPQNDIQMQVYKPT